MRRSLRGRVKTRRFTRTSMVIFLKSGRNIVTLLRFFLFSLFVYGKLSGTSPKWDVLGTHVSVASLFSIFRGNTLRLLVLSRERRRRRSRGCSRQGDRLLVGWRGRGGKSSSLGW